MKWRLLNMADLGACPDAFDSLSAEVEVVSMPPSRDALLRHLAAFDLYCASLQLRAGRDVLDQAPQLRAIVTVSTGLDHIDVDYAESRGIRVLSLRGDAVFLDTVTSTAELAWALLLAAVRRLPSACASALRGDWDRERFRGLQLSAKTLGVLGYGRLGRMVAEYGKAFRMRVLACDREPVQPADGVEMVCFETLLEQADVLSVHIHLTRENHRLLDARAFSRMKPGAVLVNTSRGAIVDESALLKVLASGRLAAAGIDVVDGELDGSLDQHPLIRYARDHDNLVISPHVGGVTLEAQRDAIRHMVGKLGAFLDTISRPNTISKPTWT